MVTRKMPFFLYCTVSQKRIPTLLIEDGLPDYNSFW